MKKLTHYPNEPKTIQSNYKMPVVCSLGLRYHVNSSPTFYVELNWGIMFVAPKDIWFITPLIFN